MSERSSGRLIGVGVGPGDPELLTLKGLRTLQEADVVFVPVGDTGEIGRAEMVVRGHLQPERIQRLLFALSDDEKARSENWKRAAKACTEELRQGKTCAFATIGDPNLYSTFSYLARHVKKFISNLQVETIPGITAMQDLASRSGTVLVVGNERLALLPFTAGREPLQNALENFETVVCYKGGSRLGEVLEVAESIGRLKDATYGSHLGIKGEVVVQASEMRDREGTYLSTVVFVSSETGRTV